MTRRSARARAVTARLGLLAVLFQALLFGWHHHDLRFARHLPAAVIENPAAAPIAADDEDCCEICQVLHHMTAAPVDIAAAPPPLPVAGVSVSGSAAFAARTPNLAFRARAPPRA
jgi:hypothetical protein